MSHEFSLDPIKLKQVDLKSGEIIIQYVFVGNVPADVEKDLRKIETAYNKNQNVLNLSSIKKFYGPNWQTKLGLVNKNKTYGKGISGGSKKEKYITSEIYGGDGASLDAEIKDLEFELSDDMFGDSDILDINPESDVKLTEEEKKEIDEKRKTQIEDKGAIKTEDLVVLEEELDDVLKANDDFLIDHEKTKELKTNARGQIQFIYDTQIYPMDNFMDFKYKIYLVTGIPIYRQHLWHKYLNRSYVCSYNLLSHKHDEYINIETLISFYAKEKEMDEIEGIPVNLTYYKNKDFIQVYAQDTFNLLGTTYHKYGTLEYFITDLNDLIDPQSIYTKIHHDKHQLEVIYYGFILIYFPMITITVFSDYLKNEKIMQTVYPELKPDKLTLTRQFDLEADITNNALDVFVDYEKPKHKFHQVYKKLFSSITETMLSIDNYKQDIELLLVLRNLFDVIELNETMTYCKANLLYDNRQVILRKSYFNEIEPKDIIPLNSLLIKVKTNPDTNENMRIILFKNGNYNIKTEWREENHMDFDSVVEAASKKINPVIRLINSLGDKVKYHNIQLPEFTKKNAIFTETSLVFYYDDDTTEARFSLFKKVLEDFSRAGLIIPKESTGLGYEYFFNKGMYKFDVQRIEKAISLDNYYDYLSNGVVKSKWTTIFERTRLFSINNISSKLKITINGIRNDVEMEIFHMYLIGLLSIYEEHAEKIKVQVGETINTKSKKALKNLKLQDPLLYDFKKIYKSNVIYSKICQKPYQPLILTDDEYKQLPSERKKNAVEYWNFTKQKPVWYSCPNPKYPYIKFIIKQHPKDYCIPCCKKIAMNENVNKKKQEIHNICMKEHKFTGEKVSLTKGSHYIATYGKNIETGRLSRLPEHTLEPLFFDTYSPEGGIDQECITADGYYLFGVDQHLTTVQNIGYLYCLIHSLNKSLTDFLLECSTLIKKTPDKFRVILDGNAGLYFDNADDLANTIKLLDGDTLLNNKLSGQKSKSNNINNKHKNTILLSWNDLFISIAYYYYGINTIIFEDKQKELIDLMLPKGLKNVNEMFPDSHKNLVVLRKKSRYNPIYLLNTEIFKRVGLIDTRLFLNESGLITIIRAVVRRHFEKSEYEKIKLNIDLAIIREFVSSTDVQIKSYFVNYSNLCYAVLLSYKDKVCYIPIFPSHYSLEKNTNLIFSPYSDKYSTEYSSIQKIASVYNKWVGEKSKKEGLNIDIYPTIKVEKWLYIKGESKPVIGFINNEMYYYCKPMSESDAKSIVSQPMQKMLYSPHIINSLIYSIKNGERKIEQNQELENKLQKSTYYYYLYHLVLLQFINMFNHETNKPLRKKLYAVLAKTNFDKDMSEIREFIKDLEIEDANKIKNIISRFITIHHDKKQMMNDIDETKFNFDKVNLEKLKQMPYDQVFDKLKQLSKQSIEIGEPTGSKNSPFIMPNMLTACGTDKSIQYCSGSKLLVPKNKLEEILRILAADIINPTKWKWLFNSIFVEKTIDYFKFIQRPDETITVEMM